jgi:hypothetical protein
MLLYYLALSLTTRTTQINLKNVLNKNTFHLCDIQQQANLIYSSSSQRMVNRLVEGDLLERDMRELSEFISYFGWW